MGKGKPEIVIPHKDVRQLARKAEKQGWNIEMTSSYHVEFHPPDGGPPIRCGGTPSKWAIKQTKNRLRKAGVEC